MEKKLSVHSENILPIIKKWLYSEKEIFLRELISNGIDAISKLQIIRSHEVDATQPDFCINVTTNKTTITISDNGIGMTEKEVETFIAQIAFSGAEEFLQTYKTDQIIGHFGLGFYSAYMVAKRVEIKTLSYTKEAPVFWSCDGTSSYTIEKASKDTVGTDVTLFVEEEEESQEFLKEEKLKSIILKYFPFSSIPIYLNGKKINGEEPLWLKKEISDKEATSFYKEKLYPFEDDPIFWISINMDYPFNIKGILYFPKITQNFDFKKSNLKLFCNKIFVSDNCKDLLPDYLTILKGALDSAELPLNVSRSHLQMDKNVKQLGGYISKKIAEKLSSLYTEDKEKFISIWSDIEIIIKLGVLQDEKFYDKIKNCLIWKDVNNKYFTIEELSSKDKTIYYTMEEKPSKSDKESDNDEKPIIKNPLIAAYCEKTRVLSISHQLDISVFGFLEKKLSCTFQRIDSNVDMLLDPSRDKNILEADGKSQRAHLEEVFASLLDMENVEISAKSLADDNISSLLLFKEEERRMRDYFNLTKEIEMDFPIKKTFVVNTNHPLILKIKDLAIKDRPFAKDVVSHLYDLSQISQKEFNKTDMSCFIERSTTILNKLLTV